MDENTKNLNENPQEAPEAPSLPKLRNGMRTEVLTLENRLIFVGKLELLRGGVLQINEESGQDVPPVEYNSKVKLRVHHDGTFAFYGKTCGSSRSFWRVDRLEALQASEKREFFRQTTSIDAWIMCVNKIFDPGNVSEKNSMRRVACRLLDISGGGALVRCKEPYKLGDWVLLTGVVPSPELGEFTFTCRIQRVKEERNYFDYGCRFEGLTEKEQDRLMRAILVLQRKALQARRGRADL